MFTYRYCSDCMVEWQGQLRCWICGQAGKDGTLARLGRDGMNSESLRPGRLLYQTRDVALANAPNSKNG